MNHKARVATITVMSIAMLGSTILLTYGGAQQAEAVKKPEFCYSTKLSGGHTDNCFTTIEACNDALHDDPGATSHKCKAD